ncbi:MAG: peptidoglycan-associated lipoprotein Pal [Nitrospirae bacterium]|nr:peptidoglycan-associated lipoprotein Pal [Nitrospirota bacterium]
MKRFSYGWLAVLLVLPLLWGCAEEPVKPDAQPAPGTKELTDADKMREKGLEGERIAKVMEEPALKDIYFDYDKSDIRGDAKAVLRENAAWLKQNPKALIQIEGHCDERGTNEYNMALGDRRARATKDYLSRLGISGKRIATVSFGEEKPVCTQQSEACWAKNRRAHFVQVAK